jgi:phosphate transport system protein
MAPTNEHIVKSFDDELRHLHLVIARMGGLAEEQLANALSAISEQDSSLAMQTVQSDTKVDELERDADAQVIRLLALRQPMANDLRQILAALKIAAGIERIADYAKNVAKRAIALNELPAVQPVYSIPRIGRAAVAMLKDVLDAYNANDAEKALEVWNRDETLFIAKNLERIGDHCTNIAENVYFLVTGRQPGGERPKGGKDELNVVAPIKQTPH